MIRHKTIRHEFVETVPAEREEGVVYVSIPFSTAVHNCLCGCGMKVVTPIKPHKWVLTFDGESISLNPSVGNWSFPCQSHYVIRKGQVIVAAAMTERGIAKGRAADEDLRRRYLGADTAATPPNERPLISTTPAQPAANSAEPANRKLSFWQRLGLR